MAAPVEFITIADFSPGIHVSKHDTYTPSGGIEPAPASVLASGSIAPAGAAQTDGTWGCTADATGALEPLPKRVLKDSSTGVYSNTWGDTLPGVRPGIAYLLDAQLSPATGQPTQTNAYSTTFGPNVEAYKSSRESHPVINYLWVYRELSSLVGETVRDAVHGYTRRYDTSLPHIRSSFLYVLGSSIYTTDPASTDGPFLPKLCSGVLLRSRTQDVYSGSPKPENGTTLFNPRHVAPTVVAVVSASVIMSLNDSDSGALHPGGDMVASQKDALYPAYDENGVLGPPFLKLLPSVRLNGPGPTIISSFNRPTLTNGGPDGGDQYLTPAGQVGIQSLRVDGWAVHTRDQAQLMVNQSVPSFVKAATIHQGRLVFVDQQERTQGNRQYTSLGSSTAAQDSQYHEVLWYSDWLAPLQYWDNVLSGDTPVNDIGITMFSLWSTNYLDWWGNYGRNVASRPYYSLLPDEDSLSPSGCIGTVSNSQLLQVKYDGGGVLISGDLDNPTVRRLPSVESTHGVVAHGTQTPAGFVYGATTGVYAWTGGDTTQNLSPQIDGFFWDHTEGDPREQYDGPRGRFCYWNDAILAPNNYLMDTRSGGWWRLEKPVREAGDIPVCIPYNCYDVGPDGELWAFPYKIIDTTHTDSAFTYSLGDFRSYYSWKSRPLAQTDGRSLSFQDVELLVSHSFPSRITVTLTGLGTVVDGFGSGAARQTITRSVTMVTPTGGALNDRPNLLRADIPADLGDPSSTGSFTAEFVSVQIEVQGLNSGGVPSSDVPAARIHSLKLGIGQRSRVMKAG